MTRYVKKLHVIVKNYLQFKKKIQITIFFSKKMHANFSVSLKEFFMLHEVNKISNSVLYFITNFLNM